MPEGIEQINLQDIKSLHILDTLPEKEYDTITSLAAAICDTPISLVSIVTDTRQFFKSHHGLDATEAPIDQSFCAHAIKTPDALFVVEDARKDERFKNNPLVTGKPGIVFYAGIPLISREDNVLGTLCIMDNKPRKLEQYHFSALESLAHQIIQLFELRKNRIELKEVNDALSAESQHLQNIIDATHIGTWEWNIENCSVKINDWFAQMLGYTLDELGTLHIDLFQKFLYPQDIQHFNDKITDHLEKKSDYFQGEYRFFHKKGHILWITAHGQVIKWSADGKPLLMAGTHLDITERRTTQTQFKNITNNIPGAVFRYKLFPNGTNELLLVSDGAKTLWGFSADEIMNDINLIWDNTIKDDVEALNQSIKRSAKDLSFWQHIWRYQDPKGKVRWCKGSGNPFRTEDGSTVWDSIIIDITTQKENELKIEQSEKRFKGLVQNSFDLISILDSEINYQYISSTSTAVIGISPEDFVGKSLFDFVHPDEKQSVSESLKRIKIEEQVVLDPFRFKHGDGSWRWLETIITNLTDDPSVGGIVANSKDITETYNHIEAIEYQNDKLRKIAWKQSHIVRAPLARIMALAEVLKYDSSTVDQNKKVIGYIQDSAIELDNVVRDIVNSTYPDLN
jgi:PAS domain S-box-containing protein